MKRVDMTGQRFGLLVCVEFVEIKSHNSYWRCKCDCGNECIVGRNHLLDGHTKSCGCYHDWCTKYNNGNSTHGLTHERLYAIWTNMKQRCYNTLNPKFKRYGARGIRVCDEWYNSFESFYEWSMQNGYKDDLTIDRIDNNGNYEPSNCRFVDCKTQMNNYSKNRWIEYNGETLTLTQWADKLNMSVTLLGERLRAGWDFEKAITTPVRKLKHHDKN